MLVGFVAIVTVGIAGTGGVAMTGLTLKVPLASSTSSKYTATRYVPEESAGETVADQRPL
jgi:hypothetical protein